jgi:hypothetical protein
VESTATTEITQIPTTSEFNASNPLPMYKISGTSTLKQEDLQPELDITTNAEQQMRDAGFGGQLDLVVKFIYKYLNLDTSINEHTFQTVYALNPYSDPPVYTAFIYDRQADCLRYPYFYTSPDNNNPESREFTYAHSGDAMEIMNLAEANGAFIYYTCLTSPVGLGDGVKIRFIATKTGIVPGAFYNDDLLVGWFDFENRIWHLTEEAKGWLKILDTNPPLQENLANWLNGQTVIAETEIFDNGSRTRKFNIFDPALPLTDGSPQFYGILLGTDVINGQLLIFLGFEDVNSRRYYLPFNLGSIDDEYCSTSLTAVTSNTGQQHRNAGDQTSTYQCSDLAQVLSIFLNKPVVVTQYSGDLTPNMPKTTNLPQNADYAARQEYAASVAKFIYNSAYTPIGNNDLDGRVNAAPSLSIPLTTHLHSSLRSRCKRWIIDLL